MSRKSATVRSRKPQSACAEHLAAVAQPDSHPPQQTQPENDSLAAVRASDLQSPSCMNRSPSTADSEADDSVRNPQQKADRQTKHESLKQRIRRNRRSANLLPAEVERRRGAKHENFADGAAEATNDILRRRETSRVNHRDFLAPFRIAMQALSRSFLTRAIKTWNSGIRFE